METQVSEVSRVSELTSRVNALRAQSRLLSDEIDSSAKEAKSGNVPGSLKLNTAAAEKSQVDTQLAAAEKALAAAKAEAARAFEADRRQQFKDVIAGLESARADVVEHVRIASLAFGRFFELQKEAVNLLNATTDCPAYVWPHERAAYDAAIRWINPYSEWPEVTDVIVDMDKCFRIFPKRKLWGGTSSPLASAKAATGKEFGKDHSKV